MKPLLILGIGNVIMQDEGVGIHVVRQLEQTERFPEGVDLLDGATGGYFLLGDVTGYEHLILIDATLDSLPPGTIRVIRPRYADDYPPLLSAHEFGLKNMLDAMTFLERMPETHLVVVSVREVTELGLSLTPEVAAVVPEVVQTVKRIVAEVMGEECVSTGAVAEGDYSFDPTPVYDVI